MQGLYSHLACSFYFSVTGRLAFSFVIPGLGSGSGCLVFYATNLTNLVILSQELGLSHYQEKEHAYTAQGYLPDEQGQKTGFAKKAYPAAFMQVQVALTHRYG